MDYLYGPYFISLWHGSKTVKMKTNEELQCHFCYEIWKWPCPDVEIYSTSSCFTWSVEKQKVLRNYPKSVFVSVPHSYTTTFLTQTLVMNEEVSLWRKPGRKVTHTVHTLLGLELLFMHPLGHTLLSSLSTVNRSSTVTSTTLFILNGHSFRLPVHGWGTFTTHSHHSLQYTTHLTFYTNKNIFRTQNYRLECWHPFC
jgi:hypothetical protein